MFKRRKDDVRDVCARREEEDGLDPRLDELRERAEARRGSRGRGGHRDAQLAKVALRLLEQDLGAMGPAIAAGLHVVHVEVLAGGVHVRVYVAPDRAVREPGALAQWLATVTPSLRAGLARSLARKRVPTLSIILGEPAADRLTGPSEGPWP